MHTTIDESTGVRDERVTHDHRVAIAFQVLYRAVEFDGMPAPLAVHLHSADVVRLQFDDDQTARIDDWASLLGTPAATVGDVFGSARRPWRKYTVTGQIEGQTVEVWCPSLITRVVAA